MKKIKSNSNSKELNDYKKFEKAHLVCSKKKLIAGIMSAVVLTGGVGATATYFVTRNAGGTGGGGLPKVINIFQLTLIMQKLLSLLAMLFQKKILNLV